MDIPELDARLSRLSLEEKVRLLTGADLWSTAPLEGIGLGRIVVSDGPSGVRGEVWDERSPSLCLPSPTALSSTWDIDAAYRYGMALAQDARRKGVHVVLGPTVNLHRSPYGGRHFEAFSEDPVLTAELAAAYVRGLQENGVGATLKHYVANDFETDRLTVDVSVTERTLREVYLAAFEKAIVASRAWLVMSAYNSVNGASASENPLLSDPLNSDWGFDGVVISDWGGVRSLEAARFPQDLVMPGPVGPWGEKLIQAVREGKISEAVVDRKVLRLLMLAARVGVLSGHPGPSGADPVEGRAVARALAAQGSVLLKNDGLLPLQQNEISKIAVIGQHAAAPRIQGGGSATVMPERIVSPLAGIRTALPGVDVAYSLGAVATAGIVELDRDRLVNPVSGGPGVRADFLDAAGDTIFSEDRLSTGLYWFGGDAPLADASTLLLRTIYTPEISGTVLFGYACAGAASIRVDEDLILSTDLTLAANASQDVAFHVPPFASAPAVMRTGRPVEIRIEFDLSGLTGPFAILNFTFGRELDASDAAKLRTDAADLARSADIAVVVVGTNHQTESEGVDRDSLALPGAQDELVRAVVAANPRTVVVVNAGSPVLLPWRKDVPAILCTYFGGQEMGGAVADVLLGDSEPGGRLPTTWPAEEADLPVGGVRPVSGVVRYDEGLHIGYRAWLARDIAPAFHFGHGLGYTTWTFSSLKVNGQVGRGGISAECHVINAGTREGSTIVQLYLERTSPSSVDRPVRWLVGFASIRARAGATARTVVEIEDRAFAHWSDGWKLEPGEYLIRAGGSVDDLPLTFPLTVG
ncbi:glycoside hydrolase family 3 C-terminal domain-containing protein [Microbacterium sp. NPDC089318]